MHVRRSGGSTYVAEINVEQAAVVRQHNVIIVAVTNAQHVCGDAVASAGAQKVIFHGRFISTLHGWRTS